MKGFISLVLIVAACSDTAGPTPTLQQCSDRCASQGSIVCAYDARSPSGYGAECVCSDAAGRCPETLGDAE